MRPHASSTHSKGPEIPLLLCSSSCFTFHWPKEYYQHECLVPLKSNCCSIKENTFHVPKIFKSLSCFTYGVCLKYTPFYCHCHDFKICSNCLKLFSDAPSFSRCDPGSSGQYTRQPGFQVFFDYLVFGYL